MRIARLDTPRGPLHSLDWSCSPNTFVSVTPGDMVEIRLAGVGSLNNRVV